MFLGSPSLEEPLVISDLGVVSTRKVVTTDSSLTGWVEVYKGIAVLRYAFALLRLLRGGRFVITIETK